MDWITEMEVWEAFRHFQLQYITYVSYCFLRVFLVSLFSSSLIPSQKEKRKRKTPFTHASLSNCFAYSVFKARSKLPPWESLVVIQPIHSCGEWFSKFWSRIPEKNIEITPFLVFATWRAAPVPGLVYSSSYDKLPLYSQLLQGLIPTEEAASPALLFSKLKFQEFNHCNKSSFSGTRLLQCQALSVCFQGQ